MKKRILILAPHCDDEVLGCGGIMAKYSSLGHDVNVAIITNGHLGAPELFSKKGTERVRFEALEAHKILGVNKTIFLDYPAPKLDTIAAYKLSNSIAEVIDELSIDTIYIPHRGDIHKDHRITYEAALVASRPINGNSVTHIYSYETLSETEWAPPFGDDMFIPTVFEDITLHIRNKLDAFACFETQVKEYPHPRSLQGIRNLAGIRGSTIGVEVAEAFMLIRSINK